MTERVPGGIKSTLLVIALAIVTNGCTIVTTRPTATATGQLRGECAPNIVSNGGWLAADGGRSIPLPNGKSIHLFGDTLIGKTGQADNRRTTFVGNTVGVGECVGNEWRVRYVWRDDGNKRAAIFDLKDGKTRLWPVDGVFVNGRLYFILNKVLAVSHGIGFQYAGAVMATVDNPLDDPLSWRIRYQPLAPVAEYLPDKGMTLLAGYVHIFGSLGKKYPHPAILLRIPVNGLERAQANLEYLTYTGAWKSASAFDRRDVRVIDEQSSTTMYVHWHPGLNKWLTVHADPAFGSPKMVMQTADHLWGPWSADVPVGQFPEMLDPKNKGRGVICYAVTEHPQLRRAEGRILVVTYACNTLKGPLPSPEDLHLYHPKTVLIDLARTQ